MARPVRHTDELQALNTRISEALERETATNDILRVIAESPTNATPVLDVIARHAALLSGSDDAVVGTRDGDTLLVAAHHGGIPMIPVGQGIRFNRDSVTGRAMIDRRTIQTVHGASGANAEFPEGDAVAKRYGYRVTCAVPLMRAGEAIGAIAIRRISPELLNEGQIAVIQSFASQAAIAIGTVRLFDETTRLLKETEQRNAELAVINSIQQGLASKLELTGIIELVGDKLRNVFAADVVGISLLDRDRDLQSYPYLLDHGERFQPAPQPNGSRTGIGGFVLRTRQTIVFNTADEMAAFQRDHGIESRGIGGPTVDHSFVYAPLVSGGDAMGLICIGKQPPHAFAPSDVSLIATVAASLSVALQNAQSFEAERQRAAELAVINSVQAALAAELNIQGIYEAVGDKIRELFHNRDLGIRIYDPATGIISFPYLVENGERLTLSPIALPERGFGPHVIRTRETLVINERMGEASAKYGSSTMPGTALDSEKSALFVPLIVGDRARGLIHLFDTEREHAFSDSDVRLLETLAASMSVALENARLFDETQRLLKETEAATPSLR